MRRADGAEKRRVNGKAAADCIQLGIAEGETEKSVGGPEPMDAAAGLGTVGPGDDTGRDAVIQAHSANAK
jgi:hypothetical protein